MLRRDAKASELEGSILGASDSTTGGDKSGEAAISDIEDSEVATSNAEASAESDTGDSADAITEDRPVTGMKANPATHGEIVAYLNTLLDVSVTIRTARLEPRFSHSRKAFWVDYAVATDDLYRASKWGIRESNRMTGEINSLRCIHDRGNAALREMVVELAEQALSEYHSKEALFDEETVNGWKRLLKRARSMTGSL